MRTALLFSLVVASAYGAELSDDVAYVVSREVSADGTIVRAVVKVRASGFVLAVAGYAIDKDARFQFYKGGLSKLRSYDIKEIKALPGDSVEVAFKVRVPPPVVRSRIRVALYSAEAEIPTSD